MVTQADGYAEREAALLMLAEKQRGHSRHTTHHQQQQGPPLEHGPKNHAAPWLRDQPKLPLAGGKELRLAEGNRARTTGEGARAAQGRLGLRLQLCGPQPAAAAKAHRAAKNIRRKRD